MDHGTNRWWRWFIGVDSSLFWDRGRNRWWSWFIGVDSSLFWVCGFFSLLLFILYIFHFVMYELIYRKWKEWYEVSYPFYVAIHYMEGRKEMFYLMLHSTHFIYGYMALDIWWKTTQQGSRNLLPPLHRLFFLISSKGSFICTITHTG